MITIIRIIDHLVPKKGKVGISFVNSISNIILANKLLVQSASRKAVSSMLSEIAENAV